MLLTPAIVAVAFLLAVSRLEGAPPAQSAQSAPARSTPRASAASDVPAASDAGAKPAAAAPAAAAAPGRTTIVLDRDLREPFGVAFDAAGRTTYIVEMSGHRVSVLDARGAVRVLAGTGTLGLAGDDGPAIEAQFNGPHHLLMGPDGHLYVADTFNNVVRRIDLKSGIVTRVAGTGQRGYAGDGGPAIDAQFSGIFAIAFRGRVLYACDLGNRRVRAIDLRTGIVTTVAGNGEKGVPADGEPALSQPLVDPRAIAIDDAGNLYILERNGHALRVVDRTGRIRTVAGTGQAGSSGDGGPARAALMNGPKHLDRSRRERADLGHGESPDSPLFTTRR